MKNLKTIFPLCLLLAGLILTGCADSTQNSKPKSSEATTTSAVTATESAINTTSSAISASSSAMQPVDPLSIEGQLKTIAEAKDKIVTRGKYDANHHYAVTDLDQNGRLELIIATEMNGTGHITHNWYYEISKDGSKLKKCKGKAFGKEGHDILDAINTVYIDQKEHNYYYRVYGITHVSGGENYESLGFLQLKNGTFTDNYLAGGSHIVSKKGKGKLKNSYYKLTQNGNKKTAKITKKQYSDIDSLMKEKYGKLKKESVAIQWFSYQQPMSEVTESQFLHKLQKSQENFAISKKVKHFQEYNGYDFLKNLKNIDWEEQQYNMCPEDYTMLAKYLPMLKNEQKIHFPDGTEQTLDEYLTGKEDIYRQVQLVDLTGDGIKELILSLDEYVIFSYQNGEYAAFLSSEAAFELKPGGYFCYDIDNEADQVYTEFTSKLQYKEGKLQEVIVAKGERDYKNDTDTYHINGLLASEDTYCDWQDEELHPDNEPYEVYKYVLEEKEE